MPLKIGVVVQNMFTTKEAKSWVKKVLLFEKSNQMYSMHKGIAFALQGFHVLRYSVYVPLKSIEEENNSFELQRQI